MIVTKEYKEDLEAKKIQAVKKRTQKLYPELTKKSKEKIKETRLLIDFYNSETKALYEKLKPEKLTKQEFQMILLKCYEKSLK